MWATSSTSCGISRSCYRECRCFIFSLLSYDSLYPPASPHLATWIPHISPCHASPNFQRVSLPSHISPSHSLSLFVLRSRLYPTQNSASHSFTTNSRPSIWYFCSTIYSLRSYNCSHWPGCVAQCPCIFSLLIGLRHSPLLACPLYISILSFSCLHRHIAIYLSPPRMGYSSSTPDTVKPILWN